VLFTWDNVNHQPRQPLLALKMALWRIAVRRTSMVVCGNAEAQRLLQTKGYRGRSCVLPQLATPTEPFEAGQQAPPGLNRIGYIGRLVPEKGLRTLFAALSQLLDTAWTLTIVGDGPLRQELEQLAHPWAGRVQFTGALPQDAIPHTLSRMDIFVLPSEATARWKEQFGYTLALAMMAGKVVIGSTCGAIPEVIGSGGLVVPEGDPAAVAVALRRVMSDAGLREELGRKARQEALARYSPSAVASGYLTALANAHV
jgi:L-malate glycosyltransferase